MQKNIFLFQTIIINWFQLNITSKYCNIASLVEQKTAKHFKRFKFFYAIDFSAVLQKSTKCSYTTMFQKQVVPIIFPIEYTRPCNGYRRLTLIYSNKKLKILWDSKANKRVVFFLTLITHLNLPSVERMHRNYQERVHFSSFSVN